MTTDTVSRTAREERLVRRMLARGEHGLADALCGLKGVVFGRRYAFRSLYAIGGEGAVYDVEDLQDPGAPPLVGKVALHPVHNPFALTSDGIRDRRLSLRRESVLLATCASRSMPAEVGNYQFANPALDASRGGAFAEAEPVVLMEKLPGVDLDRWLARVHRRGLPRNQLQPTLDRIAVNVLQAVADLASRGFLFADLRPGNVRVVPHPRRMARLLDAGSIVRPDEQELLFPHVPAYLPPELYHASTAGLPIRVSEDVTAIMAGRTLFEIATGEPPFPGEPIVQGLLDRAPVSAPIAEVAAALAHGEIESAAAAYRHLKQCATRRVPARPSPAMPAANDATPRRVLPASAVLDLHPGRDAASPPPAALEGDWVPADFLSMGDVSLPDKPAAAVRPAPAPEPEPATHPVPVTPRTDPPRVAAAVAKTRRDPPRVLLVPQRPLWRRLLDWFRGF